MTTTVVDDKEPVATVTVAPAGEEKEYDIENVYHLNLHEIPNESTDAFEKEADFAKSLSGVSANQKRKITRMEKHFKGVDGAGTKSLEDGVITGYNAFDVVLPPYNLDYLAKLYELSAPHYAAVNAKVSNIVGLGWDFVESNSTKRKFDDLEDADKTKKLRKKLNKAKDELVDSFDNLNEEDVFAETLAKVWRDYETTGNGYIEIGRSVTGKISYIGHISAPTLRVRRQRDGFVQIVSNKAVFFRNFGKDDPNPIGNDDSPNEIIHIKKYSPTSTFYGVPDIIAAQQAVAGNEFAARFNLDYFENKAVPRHVIILKGATINPVLAKNILEFFETGLKGQNHRSLFIPLPGDTNEKKVDLKIEAVEAGIQDASFTKYKKDNLNEILMAHRTPISKVGLAEGVSLAVARDADKTFKEQVCQPEQKVFEKKLNKIVKEFTDMLIMKLNEMTLTDEDTQSKIDERRRKTGTETGNEQRVRRGLPGHKEGDELVDLNAQAKKLAQDNAANGNRERDSQRSAASTDSAGEGRNPKGEGRTT